MASDKETELLLKAKNLTDEAFAAVSARLKQLKDETKDTTTQGSTQWGKLFGTISGGVAVGNLLSSAFKSAAGVLASVPGQLLELGKRGADVASVRESFTTLNAAIGQTGDEVLPALRSAFGGAITDYNLMRDANEALSKGVKLSAADMSTMAKASRVMADQVGGDSREKWNAMMGAIANGQEKQLRTLPLDYARIEKAVDAYALNLGKEASALTISQKQTALHNAVLLESKRILTENGEVQNNFNDNLAAAGAWWENIKDRVGEAIAQNPALNVALGKAAEALSHAFGPDREAQIASLSAMIGKLAVAAVTGATYIVAAAQSIASAYYKSRAAVDSLFDAYNQKEIARVQGLVDMYQGMADKGNTAVRARLSTLKIELEGLKGYGQGLTDDANDALAANDKLNRSAEDAQKFLAGLRSEMEKAQASAKGAADGTKPFVQSTRAAGEASASTVKELLAQRQALEAIRLAQVPLTDAQKASILANDQIGVSAETTAKALGISAVAVKVYLESLKTIADIADVWADAHSKMLDESNDFIRKSIADAQALARQQMDASGQALADQLATAKEYREKNYQLTLSGTELQVRQINLARDAEIAALKQKADFEGVIYDEAKSQINAFYDAQIAKAQWASRTSVQLLDAVGQAFDRLAQSSSGSLSTIFRSAAGIASALLAASQAVNKDGSQGKGGIASPLFDGGATSAEKWSAAVASAASIASGAMNVWNATANAGSKSAGAFKGAMGGAEAGAAFGPWGVAVGAAAGVVVGFIRNLNAGRNAVKDFAAEFTGGFDGLRQEMLALEDGGDRLWKKLTQQTKRGDKAGADAVIAEIRLALANTPSALAAAAGYQTKAQLQAVADKAKQVYDYMVSSGEYTASAIAEAFQKSKDAQIAAMDDTAAAQKKAIDDITAKYTESLEKLDSEYKTLSDSVAGEAEEAEMGLVETKDRARMAEIEKEKAALEEKKKAEIKNAEDTYAATEEAARLAAQKTDDALRKIFDRGYDTTLRIRTTGLPTGSYDDGSDGAYVPAPAGRPSTFAASTSLLDRPSATRTTSAPAHMTSSAPTVVQLVLDRRGGRVLTQHVLQNTPSVLGGYGATRRR